MKRVLVLLGVMMLLCQPCVGMEEIWQSVEADGLLDAARQYAPELKVTATPDLNKSLKDLLHTAVSFLPEAIKQVVGSSMRLLVIVLLCGIAHSLREGKGAGGIDVCVLAGAVGITLVAANDVRGMLGMGRATLDSIHGFSQVALPVLAACSAATGHGGSAIVRHMATAVFSNVLITVIDKFLVGLIYAFIASYAAYAAIGNQGLKRIAELIKWVIGKTLALILIGYVSYLTVTGTVAAGADSAALKVTKNMISAFVPVVGRIISDASETIVIGAGMVKNTAGLIGMIVVLAVCVVPFLRLAVHYLGYRLSAALSATVADTRLWELISGIGSAFGLVLGMTGACAVIMLVSILSTLAGGG